MDKREQDILMKSVRRDEYTDFQNKFNQFKISVQDDSFFDYYLLKAALVRKRISIINFLLKAGCRVRNPNKINLEETPLHLAMNCTPNIVTTLLENGASIYDKNSKGETALYASFKETYFRYLKFPPSSIIDINPSIGTLLNYYCLKDKVQTNSSSISVNPANKDDMLHFHIACITNNVNAVQNYVKHGFDVNSPFSLDIDKLPELYPLHPTAFKGYISARFTGSNPLHHAVFQRDIELFEYLLQYGADISIPNGCRQTVLHILYHSSSDRMINLVFSYGNSTKFVNSLDPYGVSHFHICCTSNDPDSVQVFLDNGVDVNSPIPEYSEDYPLYSSFTPLHLAVMHGQVKIVQLLLENGAKCDTKDKDGFTPLHIACGLSDEMSTKKSIIQMLLDYKASVSVADKEGSTPLHQIFFKRLNNTRYSVRIEKIFKMLLSYTPSTINIVDNCGLSQFHIVSTKYFCTNLVEDFLKSGVAVDSVVESGLFAGYTALHFAVLYNCRDIAEMLLKWNAQVNIKEMKRQLTPLHIACKYFDRRFILTNAEKDNYDWTLEHKNRLEIIKLLILYGADVNACDTSGRTSLHYTCTVDDDYYIKLTENWDFYKINTLLKEIIQILVSNKANINSCTDSQRSLLHIISENLYLNNSEELLEFCVNKGADIHAIDINGFTPLHVAAEKKNKMLIEFLLKNKANVNAKSNDFKIPLDLLLENWQNPEIFEVTPIDTLLLLLEYGSDVNLRYENDSTLWFKAFDTVNLTLHSYTFFRTDTSELRANTYSIVKNLFNYGANINVEDSLGKPLIISLLEKWLNERDHRYTDVNVFHIVFMHLQKLEAAGFYVNENILIKLVEYFTSISIEYNRAVGPDIFDKCKVELGRMKHIQVDNYTSLFNILFKDVHELSKRVKNITLINIFKDENVDCNFPLYGPLLQAKFKKSLIRSRLLESANKSLFSVIGLYLPDYCCDLILKHLANDDIINLNTTALKIDASKEKTKSNVSEKELPAKLQKRE